MQELYCSIYSFSHFLGLKSIFDVHHFMRFMGIHYLLLLVNTLCPKFIHELSLLLGVKASTYLCL